MTDENPYARGSQQGAGQENQNVDAERTLAQAPATGDQRVDDAVARLSRLQGRPPEEHVAVLEEVHGRLRDILDDLDPSRPEHASAGGSVRGARGDEIPSGEGTVVPPGQP